MDQACARPAPCRGLTRMVLTAEPQRRQSTDEAEVNGEEFSVPEPRLAADQTRRDDVNQRVDQYQPAGQDGPRIEVGVNIARNGGEVRQTQQADDPEERHAEVAIRVAIAPQRCGHAKDQQADTQDLYNGLEPYPPTRRTDRPCRRFRFRPLGTANEVEREQKRDQQRSRCRPGIEPERNRQVVEPAKTVGAGCEGPHRPQQQPDPEETTRAAPAFQAGRRAGA